VLIEEYGWIDTLSCGHERFTSMVVDVDRADRVGEQTQCFECREAVGHGLSIVSVKAVRRVLYQVTAHGICPACGVEVTASVGECPTTPTRQLMEHFKLVCFCGRAFDGRIVGLTVEPFGAVKADDGDEPGRDDEEGIETGEVCECVCHRLSDGLGMSHAAPCCAEPGRKA
jgi:hypothetical protein